MQRAGAARALEDRVQAVHHNLNDCRCALLTSRAPHNTRTSATVSLAPNDAPGSNGPPSLVARLVKNEEAAAPSG